MKSLKKYITEILKQTTSIDWDRIGIEDANDYVKEYTDDIMVRVRRRVRAARKEGADASK